MHTRKIKAFQLCVLSAWGGTYFRIILQCIHYQNFANQLLRNSGLVHFKKALLSELRNSIQIHKHLSIQSNFSQLSGTNEHFHI